MGSPAKHQTDFEYVIVGAGPAGLQIAYYLEKNNRSYVVLEAGPVAGNFFVKYPRHRTLISINKRFNFFGEHDYNFRHDWNSLISDDPEMRFTKYTDKLFPHADKAVEYFNDFARKFNLNIEFNTRVMKVSRDMDGETFLLRTNAGVTYRSEVLIMACGAMKENIPDIPGIELATKYSELSLDKEQFDNKKVAIVGGGNSGFETADHIAGHAGIIHVFNEDPFRMAWDTHFPGNIRAVNNNIIDMFHLKSLHALRQAKPVKLEKSIDAFDGKERIKLHYDQELQYWDPPVTGHLYDHYDEVIWCGGWKYVLPDMFDDSCRPEVTPCGRLPVQGDLWQSPNIKNMYFAGTCTQMRDKRAASSFIHGFRYSAKVLAQMLEYFRHSTPLPSRDFQSIDLDTIADFVTLRMSTVSALYQLNYGVLCDVMVFHPGFKKGVMTTDQVHDYKGTARYYYELPTEWVLRSEEFKTKEHVWVLILKDARAHYPFTMKPTEFAVVPRITEVDTGCQAFIQAILRRYSYGEFVDEFALGGNLTVRCDQDVLGIEGNNQRVPNKIRNQICKELGIGGPKFDDSTYTPEDEIKHFTPWDEEKIKMMNEKFSLPEYDDYPCAPIQGPARWGRKGTELIVRDKMAM